MTTRVTGVLAVLLATLAVLPVAAQAQRLSPVMQRLLADVRGDGTISPCKYTAAELGQARRQIPPDIEQYSSAFPAALEAAIEAHARGECASDKPAAAPAATATAAPPVSTPVPAGVATRTLVPEPPEPERNPQLASTGQATPAGQADAVTRVAATTASNDPPAPVWLLIAAAAALAAAGLFFLVAGRTRRGQHSLDALRHSWGELTWRASGTWDDFRDFLRLGR
jgi:hypothetical protein